MRSFTFLVNPASGGGAAPAAVVPVTKVLREGGAAVDVTYSPGPKAMGTLVDAAVAKGDVVVSVGGDGMLSSLAGLVAKANGTLAVVPAGRGNDFARMLGLPDDPGALAALLLDEEARQVDLVALTLPGAVEPRVVAGSVYCGVDARAGEIVDTRCTGCRQRSSTRMPPCAPWRPTSRGATSSRSMVRSESTKRPTSWSPTPPTTARA